MKELYSPVIKKLNEGSKPSVIHQNSAIPRPEVASYLMKMFLPESFRESEVTHFGVIIGPSGSGKTSAVRDVCNKHPHGVIYHEITEPRSFVVGLTEELGMKTSPTTVMDLILGYISKGYRHYHQLPDNQLAGFDMVTGVLTRAAAAYTKTTGKVPVLFIDGVDLLAKRDPQLCSSLITIAKILANANKVKIILVSSEGCIMPFLELMSASNRALVYEIGDLEEKRAVEFLTRNKIAKDRAKAIVTCIGGRLVYLESSIKIDDSDWKGKEICKEIKEALFSRTLNLQKSIISTMELESETFVKGLSEGRTVSTSDLIKNSHDKKKMNEVIHAMINKNIVRSGHVME